MPANKKSYPTFKVLPLVGIELPGIFSEGWPSDIPILLVALLCIYH